MRPPGIHKLVSKIPPAKRVNGTPFLRGDSETSHGTQTSMPTQITCRWD